MALFDAFMIPNSPKEKACSNKIKQKEILTLAPFSPIPKIMFEDVKVGQKVSQEIMIHNPTSNDCQVELISKVPLADYNLELTSTNFEVAAGQGFDLLITWTPSVAGTKKFPIGLRTNIRFRTDFVILCVAVAPNKNQKKILGAQNGVKTNQPKSGVALAPRPPRHHSLERRSTFVFRGNKENIANPKKSSRPSAARQQAPQPGPQPAPRRLPSAATAAHPSRLEDLVISPFVSAQNRFKEVELSPAVNGPWQQDRSPRAPVHEAIRRETYGVVDKPAPPTFVKKLEDFETVDCSFQEVDSFVGAFVPGICSTTVKKPAEDIFVSSPVLSALKKSPEERESFQDHEDDRLSGGTYVVDRLSTDTYIKEPNDVGSPTVDKQKSCSQNLSGAILEAISEEEANQPAATMVISPPKPLKGTEKPPRASPAVVTKKPPRASPTVVTKRRITVVPDIKVFTPPDEEGTSRRQSFAAPIPRVAMPRLTLSRSSAANRCRVSPSLSKSSSRQSLFSANSSSRQSLISANSSSRQSLISASSSSRQSLISASSSSRHSLGSSAQSANSSSRMSRITSSARARRMEKSEFLYDPDALISEMINNDLVAASTSADPFLTNTLFFDDSWKQKQEKDMIKWLNVLLTPPDELAADTDSATIDIADVWQRCCRTEQVDLAPTREELSKDIYDVAGRLNSLRKAAISLLAQTEMRQVLGKVAVHIDKKLLTVREDKDLHLDTGLKYQVLELLLSYNPLWLRIGLEAIYGRTVSLASNSDVVGLAKFILENFLTDRNIVATHSHPSVPHLRLPSYADAMKKFILKKFFFVVYFLDRAKTMKLIGHDPCLFMKNSKYKESREILLAFSSMFLSGVGDILKHLALLGYHVSVKQQYIDEYEFAVTRLKDLRDGVRLVRVMEVILKKDTLMAKLRVPPISMLQKVHNMEVALKALSDAGYVITGNITAKDLVNGHYEKTLSLLWQIIYKFQAPRLEEAAKKIQSWWHSTQLHREIRARIRARRRAKYEVAATRIQAAWRTRLARKHVAQLREELAQRERAAVVIQKTWRMFAARKQLIRARQAANRIKEWFTGALITREIRDRFLVKRWAAIKIQSLFRGYLTRKRFSNLRRTAAALRIQTWFRRRRAARLLEVAATHATVWVQERQRRRHACRIIQARFRAYMEMKEQRICYLALRSAAVIIQRRFRSYILVKKQRSAFLSFRRSVIVCQQVFRAQLAMRKQRVQYLALKQATVTLQQRFRAELTMREAREGFLRERSSALKIQVWFRATLQMRRDRREFLRMKQAVSVIEERYLGIVAMRHERFLFELKKTSVVVIQRWYRSVQQMKKERSLYDRQRNAALVIQRKFRTYKLRQLQNSSAIVIQQKWRATLQMRAEKRAYEALRSAAVALQIQRRALTTMKKERANYENLKRAAIVIQRCWRALQVGRGTRREYLNLRKAAVVVQRRWRAKVQMQTDRVAFLKMRSAAIVIQRHLRLLRKRREDEWFMKAVISMQRRWKAKKLMEQQRAEYRALKSAAIFVQDTYRQKLHLRSAIAVKSREERAATKIQALWRGYALRKKQCAAFAEIHERCKNAAKAACEEKTLAFISNKAVALLRGGKLSKAMEALVALNKITVLSRELCISIAEDGVVTDMYNFLSFLNRSDIHRQFLVAGTAILLNLTKCRETIHFVWQHGSRIFFYLHLMYIWLNKEEEIFLNCATVLWHFAQFPEFAQDLLAEPNTTRFLTIFAKKAVKKNLLGSNKNENKLPAELPSWGLALKDGRPSRFSDEVFAVEMLISVLFKSKP